MIMFLVNYTNTGCVCVCVFVNFKSSHFIQRGNILQANCIFYIRPNACQFLKLVLDITFLLHKHDLTTQV